MTDNTTRVVLDLLRQTIAEEPPQDAGNHPSLELQARVGARWAEWEQRVSALRLVLGVRLVNDALKGTEQ